MGLIVQRCFEEASEIAGIVGKMRLASMTRITSTQASTVDDSPEVVALCQDALTKIRREFRSEPTREVSVRASDAPRSTPEGVMGRASGDVVALRARLEAVQDLLSQRANFLGDLATTAQRVTETVAHVAGFERVSVWLLDEGRTKITCVDLFQRTPRAHSAGIELHATDYAPYFRALETERTIAATDAHLDPRTACFSEGYLRPLGIGALLDVPIWAHGTMVGVVCHEHVGGPRAFDPDDETFAATVGALVSLSVEMQRR